MSTLLLSKKKIPFIFKAWKKPKYLEEGDVSSVNWKNNFIILKKFLNDKVAVLEKITGDQNYLKRRVVGLKFKNQDLTLRNSEREIKRIMVF